MRATTLDLRYKTRDVLNSLDRGESVVITFRGKPKGVIEPYREKPSSRGKKSVTRHPFFGMWAKPEDSVGDVMDRLRGGRFHDL